MVEEPALWYRKYKWANDDEYEGQWKNNMAEGEGVLHMADGSVYTGSFVRGKEEGKGVLIERTALALRASSSRERKTVHS